MAKIKSTNSIPPGSIISENFLKPDYVSVYSMNHQNKKSVDDLMHDFSNAPAWINVAMRIRNSLSVFVPGMKWWFHDHSEQAVTYPVGSRAMYFNVIMRNVHEIVMTAEDKHVDFRTSAFLSSSPQPKIHVITVVRYRNLFGKIYFNLIKPIHRQMIKSLLRKAEVY